MSGLWTELAPAGETPHMRVLQIEDDAKTAQSVELILRAEGHECDTAESGEIALELARTADYDIILLDIGLPDIDGYEVLRRLRNAGVTTPVIIQSGVVLRKNKVQNLGIRDVLAKPFGRHELTQSLQTVIPGSSGHR